MFLPLLSLPSPYFICLFLSEHLRKPLHSSLFNMKAKSRALNAARLLLLLGVDVLSLSPPPQTLSTSPVGGDVTLQKLTPSSPSQIIPPLPCPYLIPHPFVKTMSRYRFVRLLKRKTLVPQTFSGLLDLSCLNLGAARLLVMRWMNMYLKVERTRYPHSSRRRW